MKKNIFSLIIGCGLLLAFAGCKNPADDINLVVNTASIFKAPVLVHFTNANPTSTTAPSDFNVIISGKDAALVQMGSGETDFKALHGFLPLALKSSASPSNANPITFNIYAEVPGFAPVTKTVLITADSTSIYEVPLIEYAKPVTGTNVLLSDIALSAGTSTNAATLATSATAGLSEKATIVVPAGTQMLDASGAVINATQVKSSIVQYGSGNASIAQSFPGGMRPSNVLDANGSPIVGGVNFITGGLLSINMTAGTTPVKRFSKPLEVTQELQDGLINFDTGIAIKAGDIIPLWSLNEQTGQWKSDGNATVSAGTGGKLVAKYTIAHLSSWNMDWIYHPAYKAVAKTLEVNLLPSATPWIGGQYQIQLQSASGGYVTSTSGYVPQNDFFAALSIYSYSSTTTNRTKYGISFPYVPNIGNLKVVVYNSNYIKVAESPLFNPVTTSSVNLNVTVPPAPETINITANFSGKCSSKKVTTPLNGYVYMYDYTDNTYTYFYLSGGKIYNSSNNGAVLNTTASSVGGSIKLITGHTYNIQTYTGKTYYSSPTFILSKSNFTVPIAATANLGAVATFDTATNTLLIQGSFDINCN